MTDKFAPETDDERNEALRWILFDNHKFTSYFATYRFMKSLAPQAPDPAVMAFLKGPLRRRGGESSTGTWPSRSS
jgi:glutathione S-transferase